MEVRKLMGKRVEEYKNRHNNNNNNINRIDSLRIQQLDVIEGKVASLSVQFSLPLTVCIRLCDGDDVSHLEPECCLCYNIKESKYVT